MPFTGNKAGSPGTPPGHIPRAPFCTPRRTGKPGSARACRGTRAAVLALTLVVIATAGCSSTPAKPKLVLTGNLLVDGPNAIANGRPRDRVVWEYRTAAADMRVGNFAQARQYLDDAILTMGGIIAGDKNAKQARSYFHAESKKTFIGEPYERSMAYIYRGIIYWMDGEPDNARACFKSAELEDSDTQNREYAGDWVLPDYLDGLASVKLGGDGSDAFARAQASAKAVKLPPYNAKANTLVFLEFGPGPTKYATGEYHEQLRFMVPNSPVQSAEIKVDALSVPVAPTDDVGFQATTRGGRVMDHILGNKAVFKATTDTAGNVALIGGLATAAASDNRTAQEVGLGIALAGLASKLVSAASTPEADTRAWDNLPRYLSFACIPLPPGKHVMTVEFKDASGKVAPNLTKTVNFEIPPGGGDKVIFISDQSLTPQTI